MAWFYKGTRDGLFKIYTYPKGRRGWWILFGRPFKWIPYSAEQSVPFFVEVEAVSNDILEKRQIEFQVYREGDNYPVVAGSIIDKNKRKAILFVDAQHQHDDGNLYYNLHIFSRVYRIVRSAPIPDNYMIFVVLNLIFGAGVLLWLIQEGVPRLWSFLLRILSLN